MKNKLQKETTNLLQTLNKNNHIADSSQCLRIVDLYLRHKFTDRIDGMKPEIQLLYMYDKLKRTYSYE